MTPTYDISTIPDYLFYRLIDRIRDAFDDPEEQRKFKAWKEGRNGSEGGDAA
jgi:phytoene/squalene synthetase